MNVVWYKILFRCKCRIFIHKTSCKVDCCYCIVVCKTISLKSWTGGNKFLRNLKISGKSPGILQYGLARHPEQALNHPCLGLWEFFPLSFLVSKMVIRSVNHSRVTIKNGSLSWKNKQGRTK